MNHLIIELTPELDARLTRIEQMLEALLMGDPEQLMTGPQVEAMLFCGATKLKKLRDNCTIPCIGEGKGIRYRRADILAYMKRNNIHLTKLNV